MIAIESLNPDPTKTIGETQREVKEAKCKANISVGVAILSAIIALIALCHSFWC